MSADDEDIRRTHCGICGQPKRSDLDNRGNRGACRACAAEFIDLMERGATDAELAAFLNGFDASADE